MYRWSGSTVLQLDSNCDEKLVKSHFYDKIVVFLKVWSILKMLSEVAQGLLGYIALHTFANRWP